MAVYLPRNTYTHVCLILILSEKLDVCRWAPSKFAKYRQYLRSFVVVVFITDDINNMERKIELPERFFLFLFSSFVEESRHVDMSLRAAPARHLKTHAVWKIN